MSEKERFLPELAKQLPIKEMYQDTLHPALTEVGKGLQGATRLALAPISALVWGYDKIAEYLDVAIPEYFAKKKISDSIIQIPDASIAVPAVEALRYVAQKEGIRRLFVNLLGAAMNPCTSSMVHPAYVEIIKQLSSDDAKCLYYLKSYRKALIDYEVKIDETYSYVGSNEIVVPEEFNKLIGTHINNFIRLGLFEKIKTTKGSCPTEFIEVEDKIKRIVILDFIEETRNTNYDNMILNSEFYWLTLTDFGDSFVNICCE